MGYAEIIAAAVAAITSFISMGMEGQAQQLRAKITAEYGPEILPELDKAIAQEAGPAALQSIAEDDSGRQTQLDVDAELANIYDTGGRTQEDEAAYDVARRGVSQRSAQRAGDMAISAAQRGQTAGPLGAVLASQSGQDELEALAGLNAEVASSGRQRALQALLGRGNLAGQRRQQDWGVKTDKANATDLMNRFNASQRQASEMYNVGLPQQQFDNNMGRLAAQGAAMNGQAAGIDRQAAGVRQTGAGVANSAVSYGQGWDWAQDPSKHSGGGKDR